MKGCVHAAALREIRKFVVMTKLRDFSGLTDEDLMEAQNNVDREAAERLAVIDRALGSPCEMEAIG